MHLAVYHRHGIDEKVRHITERDRDFHHLRLALHPDDLRLLLLALAGADEKPYARLPLVHIHQQFDRIARAVFLLVGDQLEVVVAKIAALIILRAAHGEHRRALLLAAFLVRKFHGDAVLPRLRSLEDPVVALGRPLRDLLLNDLAVLINARRIQDCLGFPRDHFPVQGSCGKGSRHLVADICVATIQPHGHRIRLTRREHSSVPHNRPPRGVHHLSADRILVILIAVNQLRDRAIDLDLHLTVGADRAGLFKHQLRRSRASTVTPPWSRRTNATPPRPTRIPRVFPVAPPVARPVKPVPRTGGEPAVVEKVSLHLDLHRRLGHRRTVVVVCGNRRLEGLTESHRFIGCLHLYLELRLLVFLYAEGEIRIRHRAGDADIVVPKRSLLLEIEVELNPAIPIGNQTVLFEDNLVAAIPHLDLRRLPGERRFIAEIIARLSGPEFHMNRLPRAVNGSIRDTNRLIVEIPAAIGSAAPVEVAVSEISRSLAGSGDDLPDCPVPILLLLQHQHAFLIRLPAEMVGDNVEAPLVLGLLDVVSAVAEEFQLTRHRRTPSRIDEMEHHPLRTAPFQQHEIPHPHDHPCGIAVLHRGLQ